MTEISRIHIVKASTHKVAMVSQVVIGAHFLADTVARTMAGAKAIEVNDSITHIAIIATRLTASQILAFRTRTSFQAAAFYFNLNKYPSPLSMVQLLIHSFSHNEYPPVAIAST